MKMLYNSWSLDLLFVTMSIFAFVQFSHSQYFDPNVDDKTYLDNIQAEVFMEVQDTRAELMEQAKIIEGVAKNYIGAKLKENLFKALRILAEKELETMSMQDRPRQPRQETGTGEEEEEGSDGEDSGVSTSTRRGLIPQLALILKAIFGGNVNATKYVESASSFLPKPIGTQLVGVVSLLDANRFTTTRAPIKIIVVNATLPPPGFAAFGRTTTVATTAAPKPIVAVEATTEHVDDEDEDSARSGPARVRQVKLPGFDLLENLFGGLRQNVTTEKVLSTTESPSGFEEETTGSNKITIAALVDGVRDQIDELTRNVPDIFQGAREAYKLLESVSGLFERLGSY